MPTTDVEEMLTLAEAANALGVAHSTLARQARDGRLPGVMKKGPLWLVSRAGVEHYRTYSLGRPGRKTPGELI